MNNIKKVLVSKCLLGIPCRYDGKGKTCENVLEFLKDKEMVVVCPEVMGGLSIPRNPAEIIGENIISNAGVDVTKEYMSGANQALEMALREKVDICLLKSRSPSCGCGQIYDGTFSGNLIDGNGCTAELLLNNGFVVISEEDL